MSRRGMRGAPAALAVVLLFRPIGAAFAQADPPPPRPSAPAPAPAAVASRDETALLEALAADPITAPYDFATAPRGGKIALFGRVGTKAVHDAAIRDSIALGIPIDDQLVIDTAAVYGAMSRAPVPFAGFASGAPAVGYGGLPYVYPPPLFGYYDDPFYGFEPPLLSFPPWWGLMTAQRLDPRFSGLAPASPPGASAPAALAVPPGRDGAVEMTIDPLGYAVLRGVVATEADREAVERRLSQVPGVTGLVNLIEVAPPGASGTTSGRASGPPPPPAPGVNLPKPAPRPRRNDPVPADPGPIEVGEAAIDDRLERAFAARPALHGLPLRASIRDGVVTLGGDVPSVYEAMLAYRAAQQTPGVHEIIDELRFPVPEPDGPNPLIDQGRPEDVEPYLHAQMRRQVGDQAHIDRVRVRGDSLEVRGTVPDEADQARVAAILRSMPLTRGYRLDARFQVE